MKAFISSALCATLVVPALIQPAMANFDATGNAQRYLLDTIDAQVKFTKVVQSVADKKTSAEEGAKQIDKLSADYKKIKDKMSSATPAEHLAVERLAMTDVVNTKKKEVAAASATTALKALKASKFAGSPALEKSCTNFASLFGYKM